MSQPRQSARARHKSRRHRPARRAHRNNAGYKKKNSRRIDKNMARVKNITTFCEMLFISQQCLVCHSELFAWREPAKK